MRNGVRIARGALDHDPAMTRRFDAAAEVEEKEFLYALLQDEWRHREREDAIRWGRVEQPEP